MSIIPAKVPNGARAVAVTFELNVCAPLVTTKPFIRRLLGNKAPTLLLLGLVVCGAKKPH